MNTYPSTKITKTKILALVAAGSLTLSACVGLHPTKVSIPTHRSAKSSSLQRHSPGRAIAAWSFVNLYYQTIPPSGAIYVRTWARESLAYGEYMVFDEWAIPQGSPAPAPTPTVSPAVQAQSATISAPPQPCPVMIETVQTNSNGVNVIISRCY